MLANAPHNHRVNASARLVAPRTIARVAPTRSARYAVRYAAL